MEDIKQKLSELEEQVSSIKDPNLKKIAFEKLLENSFGLVRSMKGQKIPASHKKKTASKSKSTTSLYYSDLSVRDLVKGLNVTGTYQNLPSFKSCKSKIDCYLWILSYAKKHKIDGLNNHEIAFILSKKLYKTTKYSTVNGIRRKVKDGLVIKEPGTENWKITPDGEEHLKTLSKE